VAGVLLYGHMEKTFNLNNIEQITKEIIEEAKKENRTTATIITFSGELGAGKTTITKELAKQLGIKENVVSPTFVIMKIYNTKDIKFKKLIHIDAYRLDKSEELLRLGWEEIISNKDNLIVVEWPERVSDCFPRDVIPLKLEHNDENTRTIKFCYNS
jgi:tRNA threonylcarbamoyladenosine biosynthesis protein TsaE